MVNGLRENTDERIPKRFDIWKMGMNQKKSVAVVCGGYSGEAVVSMRSAAMVMANIDRDLYTPTQVVISVDRWYALSEQGEEWPVDKNDFSIQVGGEKLRFDGVFMIVHGAPGENGVLQGYFNLMGIPYTTGDVLNMSMTFNKKATTDTLGSLGYQVANSVIVSKKDQWDAPVILSKVGLPCFVKPNNGGSSLGTSKVKEQEGLALAIEKALAVDDQVIIERFVSGTEVTCGVIRWNGQLRALPLTEIVTTQEFFDFEAKYNGASEEITPARVDKEVFEKVQELAVKIYGDLNCRGMIRVDFIIQSGVPFVIEVNTVPGFSEASIIPQQAAAVGIDKKSLISAVIEGCF
jgi:D-alanine-D-alanine ligase